MYLHTASGARKSSGSYYTPEFAVEHLLDHALEPALDDHLNRLEAMHTVDPRTAAEHFFDFHVADIAMGSGHFLVAAIDRIERKLSGYLAKRPLAGVRDELERLRTIALETLGKDYGGEPIEDTQLLRRQIARRCIHGVDLNPVAVELARLSIWIHTFVPGLPLSFLDANLVVGNSLVGIATLDEVRELSVEGGVQHGLFDNMAEELLADARPHLERLAKTSEATVAEVKHAREAYEAARESIRSTEEYFTILAASRIDDEVRDGRLSARRSARGEVFEARLRKKAHDTIVGLHALHFPVAFPQVFLGRRSGFDVIIGNPPWQEATIEELAFWARYDPGLRGLSRREHAPRIRALRRRRAELINLLEREQAQAERLRQVLTTGPYPGMSTGDPDLYKAFCWRFWSLVSPFGGRIGVVLPREVFSAKGSTAFRDAVFAGASELSLTMLLNNKQWVFPNVHPQTTVALAVLSRQADGAKYASTVRLEGPYTSFDDFQQRAMVAERPQFSGSDPRRWNDTSSLPLLPALGSPEVFLKLRAAPRLDVDDKTSWRARPYRELDATNDAELMDLQSATKPRGFWPIYKGESFDLWSPDTGTYYGWANPRVVLASLQSKRERAARSDASPFAEFPVEWVRDSRTLPCHKARIAFRDVSRATDTRTVRVALVPPDVVITNTAPFLLWPRGNETDQAYLLGVLSSIPLDWYARRFVEKHLNYFVFNPLPVPRPPNDSRVRTRIAVLAARLATPDDRFEEWAGHFGLEPKELAPDEKEDHIHELDAAVAHLYGLEERDVTHIFETFHEGWDYEERLRATLKHFRRLAK